MARPNVLSNGLVHAAAATAPVISAFAAKADMAEPAKALQPRVERGLEFGGQIGSGHLFAVMPREGGGIQYSVTAEGYTGGG